MDSIMIQTLMDGLKLMCVVYIMIEISKYAITVVYDGERRQLREKQIQVMDEVLELLRKSRIIMRPGSEGTEPVAETEPVAAEPVAAEAVAAEPVAAETEGINPIEENHHVD